MDSKPLPFFFVGKDITNQRISDYVSHKHNLLSQSIGKQDTKCIWYSKEHISKLLEEIEYAGGDGVKISFGMYESTHEYAGQICLLMNSTREKIVAGNVLHSTIVLENEPDYADRSALPRDVITFPGNASVFSDKDFNYGSLCPPRCDIFDGGE